MSHPLYATHRQATSYSTPHLAAQRRLISTGTELLDVAAPIAFNRRCTGTDAIIAVRRAVEGEQGRLAALADSTRHVHPHLPSYHCAVIVEMPPEHWSSEQRRRYRMAAEGAIGTHRVVFAEHGQFFRDMVGRFSRVQLPPVQL